jgi:hypothetical protein
MGFIDNDRIGTSICDALGLGNRLVKDVSISFTAGDRIRVSVGEWMSKQQGDALVAEIRKRNYVLVDAEQHARFKKWQELDATFSLNGDTETGSDVVAEEQAT